MTDIVLIQDGKAHQVITEASKAEYCYRVHDGEAEPRAIFPQGVIDAMVEVESGTVGEGWAYSDGTFTPPIHVPKIEDYQSAIEAHVNTVARQRGYSSAVSCASYVSSTMPQWAAEAGAFIAWRDAAWAYAFSELEKVQSGQREVPALDAFLAELPAIEWPE
jgi:hypothetical protein